MILPRFTVADGGFWSSPSSWSETDGGAPGASVPDNSRDFDVTTQHSILLDINPTIGALRGYGDIRPNGSGVVRTIDSTLVQMTTAGSHPIMADDGNEVIIRAVTIDCSLSSTVQFMACGDGVLRVFADELLDGYAIRCYGGETYVVAAVSNSWEDTADSPNLLDNDVFELSTEGSATTDPLFVLTAPAGAPYAIRGAEESHLIRNIHPNGRVIVNGNCIIKHATGLIEANIGTMPIGLVATINGDVTLEISDSLVSPASTPILFNSGGAGQSVIVNGDIWQKCGMLSNGPGSLTHNGRFKYQNNPWLQNVSAYSGVASAYSGRA